MALLAICFFKFNILVVVLVRSEHPHTMLPLALFVGLLVNVSAFPDGAPVDACVKERPNQPYHGQARTQPLETNPFRVVASSRYYNPGSTIIGKHFYNLLLKNINITCLVGRYF